MERTLRVLYRNERPGYGQRPGCEVRLTLESFEGKRYAAWGAYTSAEATKPQKVISVRQEELSGLMAALQQAQGLWSQEDAAFTSELSHAEYAATLDWG